MEYSELKKRHFGNNDTDKKLTDEEIISSLEVIAATRNCDECKIRNCKWGTCNCSQITANAALDLIKCQKIEIKRLQKEVSLVSIQFQDLQERYEESQAEIERLKECPRCVYEYDGETMEYCVRRKPDDKLFQFYAGTGKIMGFENKRGIHSLIRLLDDMRKEDEGKCQK